MGGAGAEEDAGTREEGEGYSIDADMEPDGTGVARQVLHRRGTHDDHPARELEETLDAAGIPKWTDDGKVDLHACRVAYITLLFEDGADVKTVQALARHCDPRITMNVYARSRRETLAKATEALGEAVLTPTRKETITPPPPHVESAVG